MSRTAVPAVCVASLLTSCEGGNSPMAFVPGLVPVLALFAGQPGGCWKC